MRKWWLIATLLLMNYLCNGIDAHEQDLLKTKDVTHVMQQILSEHLGKKEVTGQVLQNALLVYVSQFDPNRMYLIESEITPFTKLSSNRINLIIEQYNKGDFTIFKELNQVIQSSIERSRRIRQNLEGDFKQGLFHSNQDKGAASHEQSNFALTTNQLKERILQNFAEYISLQKRRFGEGMTAQRKDQILRSYEARLKLFENQYLYQNDKGEPLSLAEQENLFTIHILKALASSLDAHTSFYEANEAQDMRMRLQKEFKGIGVVLKDAQQGVTVTHILSDSPASRSQMIEKGDILLEVDGKRVADYPFEKTIEMLHGEKGTPIKLTFQREDEGGGNNKIYTVELKRDSIILNDDRVDVSSQSFGNGIIGIITLHSFYQGDGVSSDKDVLHAIEQLEKKGTLRGLILDLRDNTGGFLSQAVKVAGLFITDGVIVISKYSNGEERYYRDVDVQNHYDGPLIILTSKLTASAAEIVAQALQDYGVALVVGDEHTYGKGTIQTQTVTDNQSSSYFKVTVGKYYTVSGNSPQKQGVKADILVPGRWNSEQIGETENDSEGIDIISPAYQDGLKDVSSDVRPWYLKYYIPHLQHRILTWRNFLPTLKKNSEYRIAQNKNYQFFLKGKLTEDEGVDEEEWNMVDKKHRTYGESDLQLQEAVNILKDMVLLQSLGKESKN